MGNNYLIRVVMGLPVGFLLIVSLPWPTLPGQGLTLTLNLLVWLWCSLCCAGLLMLWHRRHLRGVNLTRLLLAGLGLMSLPLLWTAPEFQGTALWRLTAMAAMLAFFLLLLQYPFRGNQRQRLYDLIVLAALIQAVYTAMQLWFPALAHTLLHYNVKLRPTGTLLQSNLLGSFLATGLLCALWQRLTLTDSPSGHCRVIAVFMLSAAVMMTESRTAYIGAGLGSLLLLLMTRFATASRRMILLIVLMAGGLAGHAGLSVGVHAPRSEAEYQHSNQQRLAMFHGSERMIVDRPFAGQGLGSFERHFPESLFADDLTNPFSVTITHPHNEILYVWSEGGVLAFAGLLLWGSVLASPALACVAAPRRWRVAARGTLLFPLGIHLMTEFPLYLSAAHALLLVVLLRLALPARVLVPSRVIPYSSRILLAITGLIMCAAGALFMATGIQSAFRLQEAERFRLMDPALLTGGMNSYAQADRLQFDRAVSALMQYNLTSDPSLLREFDDRATDWLSRHNDASLIATQIQIALKQQRLADASYWQHRGCLSFSLDPRFHCNTTLPLPYQGNNRE